MAKIIFAVIFSLLMLCFVGGLFFVGIGFPIWAIVDCAVSKEKGTGAKVGWIIFMFFTSILGAIIYSLCASTSKALRTASIWVTVLIIIAGTGFGFLLGKFSSVLKEQADQSIAQLNVIDTNDLSLEEVDMIRKDLTVLSSENRFNFANKDQIGVTTSMLRYFEIVSKDKKIGKQEYQDWTQKFEMRKTFKYEEFEDFVKKEEAEAMPVGK